jgi:predicted metal-dependent HD superfamily phosphohydrolase
MIRKYYEEPHRIYHNWDHIEHGAKIIHENYGFNLTILLAWLCHDLVYVPSNKDNEKDSVKLMKHLLRLKYENIFNSKKEEIKKASRYIELTKHHYLEYAEDCNSELAILLDADMAYLCEGSIFFNDSREKIRKEFIVYSDDEFVQGSIAFFEDLLKRKQIFYTEHYVEKEKASREQVSFEIKRLNSLV